MRKPTKTQAQRLTLLCASAAILLNIATPATAINWGEPDGDMHPNVGALMAYDPDWGWIPMCSGTLIAPRLFLTAGHCTSGSSPGDIYVCFDEKPRTGLDVDPENVPGYLEVVEVITHAQYRGLQPRSNPHDVGILILKEAIDEEEISPAIIPYEGLLDDLRKDGLLRQGSEETDFTVVGYGGTLSWPPPSINYKDQRQYAESEFQALLKSWLRLSQNHVTGDGGSCYGDSGGPAFLGEVLVGITSWGDIPCVATAFCYRVDTADTLSLIAEAEACIGANQ